jgi:hypothetical protein
MIASGPVHGGSVAITGFAIYRVLELALDHPVAKPEIDSPSNSSD